MGCWRYGGKWPEIGMEAVDLGQPDYQREFIEPSVGEQGVQ
jgi:hypothetical protein